MEENGLDIQCEDFDDLNKDGPCIMYNDERSELTGKKCYSVKKFSQIIPDLRVCEAKYDGCVVNNNCLYYCIPCVRRPKSTEIYPDGTVVSIRWVINGKFVFKGFHGKKFVVPILKIFVKGRNLCVRFYKSKIHMTGKIEEKNLEKAFRLCEEILTNTYKFWKNCHRYPDLFIASTKWLQSVAVKFGERVIVTNEDGSEYIDYETVWPSYVPEEYHYFVTEMTERYSDVFYMTGLMKRTEEILACEKQPSYKYPVVKNIYTSLFNTTYDLGFPINPAEVLKFLEKRNYNVFNHDVDKSNLRIEIVDEKNYPDDYKIKRKPEKQKQQTLTISRNGIISHNGTGYTRHQIVYEDLMRDMILLFKDE